MDCLKLTTAGAAATTPTNGGTSNFGGTTAALTALSQALTVSYPTFEGGYKPSSNGRGWFDLSFSMAATRFAWTFTSYIIDLQFIGTANTIPKLNLDCRVYSSAKLNWDFLKLDMTSFSAVKLDFKDPTSGGSYWSKLNRKITDQSFQLKCWGSVTPSAAPLTANKPSVDW